MSAALRLVVTCAFFAPTHAPTTAFAQGRSGAALATLLRDGADVSVNGQQAANGTRIFSGDTVTTGPTSSARLDFYVGGSVQLDANTDPTFWEYLYTAWDWAQQAFVRCLVLTVVPRTGSGQLHFQEGEQVACLGDPFGRLAFLNSEVNFQFAPGREVLTVVKGQVTIAGAQWTNVTAGTQVSIVGGRIVKRLQISPQELSRITAWRYQYAIARPSPPPVAAPPPGTRQHRPAVKDRRPPPSARPPQAPAPRAGRPP